MISKATIKYLRSLELKKNRHKERLFVAEGPKVVGELAAVATPQLVVATAQWLADHADVTRHWAHTELVVATEDELRKASFLQHPQQVMAVFPFFTEADDALSTLPSQELCLALDGVQDPGNLGTIIRIADWFGIAHIFCSTDTADVYNPKVVQATMGSVARVGVHYVDLAHFIGSQPQSVPVYGTLLDGDNIYSQPLSQNGIIVMGNEGNGISPEIRRLVNRKLLIPSFPPDRPTAESLNVAIATAITCAEFRKLKI